MQYSKLKRAILGLLNQQLNKSLFYHSLNHTKDVLSATEELCVLENISRRETKILLTAALLHDAGFVENKHLGHEAAGCALARKILPDFGYANQEIEQICSIIMATKIPQSPIDKLGEILCDADLDYLGRDDFYPIAHSLFEELKSYGIVKDQATWDQIQIGFLEAHAFFTETNRQRREPEKQKRIAELKLKVS